MTDTLIPGTFGVCDIEGAGGRAIAVGQWLRDRKAKSQHAFIVVDTDGTVVEAEPGGAVYGNVKHYTDVHYWNPEGLATHEQLNAIVQTAHSLIGTPYNWADYAALVLVQFHIRPAWITEHVNSGSSLICSQLVDYAFRTNDVHLFNDGRVSGDVTPGELRALIDSQA